MIGHRLGGLLGHLLGHALGQANEENAGPVPERFAFAGGTPVSSNSTTSATVGKPQSQAGDILLLFVVAVSDTSPPNASWTLLQQSANPNFNMRLDIYWAPGGTDGNTVTQVTAGAMSAAMVRVRSASGKTLSLGAKATDSDWNTTDNPEPMASVTPDGDGMAFAVGGSAGQSASTTVQFTASTGWRVLYPDPTFRWRLALAVQNCKSGVATSGSFGSTGYIPPSTSSWVLTTLVIKES